jgi:hypothetical protein
MGLLEPHGGHRHRDGEAHLSVDAGRAHRDAGKSHGGDQTLHGFGRDVLAEANDRLRRLPGDWRLPGIILAATLVTWGICAIIAFAFVIAVEGDMR